MATFKEIDQAIIRSFKRLIKNHTFDAISVGQIALHAHITRRAFYNHFRDKYDLVSAIFDREIMQDIMRLTTIEHWADGSLLWCKYLRDNQNYYAKLLPLQTQNSLRTRFYEITSRQVGLLLKQIEDQRKLSVQDQKIITDYVFYSYIGLLEQWLTNAYHLSPEEFVERWKTMLGKSLENYANKYSLLPIE